MLAYTGFAKLVLTSSIAGSLYEAYQSEWDVDPYLILRKVKSLPFSSKIYSASLRLLQKYEVETEYSGFFDYLLKNGYPDMTIAFIEVAIIFSMLWGP